MATDTAGELSGFSEVGARIVKEAVAETPATEEFMNCNCTSIPCVIVVKDDEAPLGDLVEKLIETSLHALVPVSINP